MESGTAKPETEQETQRETRLLYKLVFRAVGKFCVRSARAFLEASYIVISKRTEQILLVLYAANFKARLFTLNVSFLSHRGKKTTVFNRPRYKFLFQPPRNACFQSVEALRDKPKLITPA